MLAGLAGASPQGFAVKPDNVRRSRDHDLWRQAMRDCWAVSPGLTFLVSYDDHLVALGGFVHSNPQAANDRTLTPRP